MGRWKGGKVKRLKGRKVEKPFNPPTFPPSFQKISKKKYKPCGKKTLNYF